MDFTDDTLYACGEEGGQVAGLVRWDQELRVITWFQPGGRQRAYNVEEVIVDTEDQFAFIDSDGRKFVLTQLTPDDYNANIRRPGTPSYPTAEALLGAYRRSLG